MHAAIFNVTIHDRPAAEAGLHEHVVPSAKSAQGFVAGYWLRRGDDKGTAVVVFETEADARAWVEAPAPPNPAVDREGSEVLEVVASA